jgi:hypothetical protein
MLDGCPLGEGCRVCAGFRLRVRGRDTECSTSGPVGGAGKPDLPADCRYAMQGFGFVRGSGSGFGVGDPESESRGPRSGAGNPDLPADCRYAT